MEYNTKDALGSEIIFGHYYGYSSSHGGVTAVKIGKAVCFTEKGLLSMTVESCKSGFHNEELTDQPHERKRIAVKPSCLFPVQYNVYPERLVINPSDQEKRKELISKLNDWINSEEYNSPFKCLIGKVPSLTDIKESEGIKCNDMKLNGAKVVYFEVDTLGGIIDEEFERLANFIKKNKDNTIIAMNTVGNISGCRDEYPILRTECGQLDFQDRIIIREPLTLTGCKKEIEIMEQSKTNTLFKKGGKKQKNRYPNRYK